MKKKITFILLVFMMLGAVAYFYVNRILLPGQIKNTIEGKISEFTQRPVKIGKISFKISKGISLENILIKEGDGHKTFLQIDEIYFNLLFLALIKNKTVIIPSLTIKKPVIQIIQFLDGTSNLSNIIKKSEIEPRQDDLKVFVTKFKVLDGKVDFLQKKPDHDFSESFRNIYLDMTITAKKQLSYKINAFLPLSQSNISLKGQYLLGDDNIIARLSLNNIDLLKYIRQFYTKKIINFKNGQLSNAEVTVQYNKGQLKLSGDAYLTNVDFQISPDNRLSGNIRVLNSIIFADDQAITASGEIRIPSARVDFGHQNSFEGDIQAMIISSKYSLSDQHVQLSGGIKSDNSEINLINHFKFKGNVVSNNASLIFEENKLSLKGDIDISSTNLYFTDTHQYSGHLLAKSFSLEREQDNLKILGSLKSTGSSIIFGQNKLLNSNISTDDFQLDRTKDSLTINSLLKFEDAVISFQQGYKFQGAPGLKVQFIHNFNPNKNSIISGTLTLNSGYITGLPYIETASNIIGDLLISADKISTESISFNTQNTNLKLSGDIIDLNDPYLDLELSTESIDLKRIMKFFPDFFKKHKIDLAGLSAVRLTYLGKPELFNEAEVTVNAQLKDSTLITQSLPDSFENLNGAIQYSKNRFGWTDLSGTYRNFPFKLNGELINFSKPLINTSLQSPHLDAQAKIQLYNNTIRLPELDVKYFNSDFKGSADIYLFEDVEPDIQITGKANIDSSDIAHFFPGHKETIDPWELIGIIDTTVFFRGKLKLWEDWSLSLDGKTPTLSIKKNPLNDVKITYLQRDKNISKLNLISEFYRGKLNIVSSINLEDKQFPFKLAFDLFGADLAELTRAQKLKFDKLAGIGTLNLVSEGNLLDQGTWTGKGKFDVKDGYLWQLNIIEGLSKILLIKEFTNTVYTTSRADFKIKDKKIYTENLYLESQTMKLNSKGWIDFDQNIDIEIYPTLSEIAMIQSESIKKITSALLAQNISYIKVTGTLKKPNIDPKTSPIEILKNTTGVIKEGIGGIVDGILNP